MNDLKNILLAYFAAATSVFAAIETRTLVTIISAIVLPILFFAIGKAIDVGLQIYLHGRKSEARNQKSVGERVASEE
ncbi:MAG: hypothetical protein IPM21_07050 [Acidobacteria bacterium]|nr:hypothetical protein [Acidobacteriota bacterium]